MQKKILLTGSAGFIGFHVARKLLSLGEAVIGIDNLNDYYDPDLKIARNELLIKHKNYTFYQSDIRDWDSLREIFAKEKIDSICHLAAQAGVRYSLVNPFVYEETNNKGFLHILECAKTHKIQNIIYASSSSVYGGNIMSKGGFSETDSVDRPISVYGATKRANELLAYTYHHLYNMHLTGLRFFTVYGPWGRPDMAYFSFVKAIYEEKAIEIFNNGKMKRDFTYIDDIVDGVIAALDKAYPYEIFNLGNSHPVELEKFIKILEKKVGKSAKKIHKPMQPGDLLETFANTTHAKEKLGFEASTNIEEGLEKFVAWYMSYYNLT